jgi:hypothetical protein
MYDAYTEMFRLLLSKGKTHLEAMNEFDQEKLKQAVKDEIDDRGPRSVLLDLVAEAGRQRREQDDFSQATDLWLAGWTSEKPYPNSQVMSWYWRAPAKGKRPLGRKYLSTNQAWRALQRTLLP